MHLVAELRFNKCSIGESHFVKSIVICGALLNRNLYANFFGMNNRNSAIFAYFLCVHQRVETINN